MRMYTYLKQIDHLYHHSPQSQNFQKAERYSPALDNKACVVHIPQIVPGPFLQQLGSCGRGQAVAHFRPKYPPSLRRGTGQWALDIPGQHL